MGYYFVEATKFWSRAPRNGGPLFPPDTWAPLLFFLFLLWFARSVDPLLPRRPPPPPSRLAVAGDPRPLPVHSPPWTDPPLWGTDGRLGAPTATARAGPGRRRAWPGRRCLAASPATGALLGSGLLGADSGGGFGGSNLVTSGNGGDRSGIEMHYKKMKGEQQSHLLYRQFGYSV